ncbi:MULTISPECIES: bifunctional 4-hydroxy-2-oxoglutarate aldolase/2-dehydro-3-deoxy-phosphogluconate aldolase [unclassified Haematobacter]|uniref:bifunctional 4-hydroxy-2-oxoglutarate aldolase/2-dehydro-3-deoxy-phosphogluconate aldolase n=1 Tax=unclassified Haematobacter TaxID=2640585 RepID=UPI0025C087F6|nr:MULTISPECIES: bifunctional 4-hydroxy-2-oxoglutarate aldolase/2-dehydro-3-deoxy-phosphogluconate aldolase [unclassified Haematobacter]
MSLSPAEASRRTLEICRSAPVIPVILIEDAATAVPMAEALVAGGLPVLEVTLRTPAALDAIRAMAKVQGGIVGAGTLLRREDVLRAKDAGATFGVSPGATDSILEACEEAELPLLPGASTASEVMALLERGYTTMKFFPAEPAGGVPFLKSLASPLPAAHFCPTGGITPANLPRYLELPNVVCCGGSWVVPADKVAAGDWAGIEALARAAAHPSV